MANSTNIRPFIQKWEGGLSRSLADNASAYPAPWAYNGQTGWHTNKGVTYKTFVSLAPKLGYQPTADNFFKMPDNIWNAIFKVGYWDPWQLDTLKSQAIADFIANASWGSGTTGSFNTIKKYLASKQVIVNDKPEAVAALNKMATLNEKTVFNELIDWRISFLKSLSDFGTFGKGWINRSEELRKFGFDTIIKKKTEIAIILIVVVIVAISIYKYYNKAK